VPVAGKPEIGMDFCMGEVGGVFRWEELDNQSVYGEGIIIHHGSLKALAQDVTDIYGER